MTEANVQPTMAEGADLMTPEELALLKRLQEKRKAQQKQLGSIKETLFTDLTSLFGAAMSKAKKDVVTVSLKSDKPYSDGNIYAVTFGVDDESETEEIDTHALALSIIEKTIDKVEPLMGISNSLKVTGTFEGKKLFWQIRKRSA